MNRQDGGHSDVLEYDLTIGLIAMEGRGFEYPTDLVAAENGRLYVANRARDLGERGVRVTVTDIDSGYYGTFAHHGAGGGNMISPMCIAKDGQGRLYITDDYTHSVSVFDFDGNFIRRWGSRGDGNGEFNGPSGIDTDSDGNIYIADTHNNRIQKFTDGGEFVPRIRLARRRQWRVRDALGHNRRAQRRPVHRGLGQRPHPAIFVLRRVRRILRQTGQRRRRVAASVRARGR